MAEQRVSVAICPRCGESHAYRLSIDTATIVTFARRARWAPTTRRQSVRVAAPCPVTGEEFPVIVSLPEAADAPIRRISLVPVGSADNGDLLDLAPSAAAAGGLTAQDKALLEAGKKLLVDSIDVGREYCKYMIGVASGAIPAYIAVLKLGLPEHPDTPSTPTLILWALPAILFLAATLVFSFGYFPGTTAVSVDNIDGIAAVREAIIRRRKAWATAGFILFAGAVLIGVWAVFAR